MVLRGGGLLALAATVAGCQEEPGRLCDRIRVVWPGLELDAGDDVDPGTAGIQVDLALRSNIEPGATGTLTVASEGGLPVAHPEPAVADGDGVLRFDGVTVPEGRVTLALTARDACGEVASGRSTFVWDGQGFPACALTLGAEPRPSEEHAPYGVLGAEDDVDPEADGIQLDVAVAAGRPDMDVALFVRSIDAGADEVSEQVSGEDRAVDFVVTLPPGEVSVRAVCTWPPEDLRPSSHTERFFVE